MTTAAERAGVPDSGSPPAGLPATSPVPVLFLISDTGGGHRSAASAVSQQLERAYPGGFTVVIEDPLRGPDAARRVRWVTSLYGPTIRLTPWLWGMLWRSCNSRRRFWLHERVWFFPANRRVAAAVAACQPAVIVCFHAITVRPAVRASRTVALRAPVVTVITDLITPHFSWRCDEVDRIVVPTPAMRESCVRDGISPELLADLGLPVAAEFSGGPLPRPDRLDLQRSLGASGRRFLVVVAGGAEGSGGIVERAAAIVRAHPDAEVAALCGRNRGARRRLAQVAAQVGGRLIVKGFIDDMADWLRCADVVVTKAGPGMIAEATCCGAPLLLTSRLPGQEEGNAELVVAAGAGRYVPTIGQLIAQTGVLLNDPAALESMRAASGALGRPEAAGDIAALVASFTAARAAVPAG